MAIVHLLMTLAIEQLSTSVQALITHIRFGQDYTYHRFQPQTYNRFDNYQANSEQRLTRLRPNSYNKNLAHQLTSMPKTR